jgi:hypothetical protein
MDVLVDVVDPGQRNQVMLTAGFRIAFRQLDVAGTFQVIHGADVLAVGTQDFHVFLDVSFVEHRYASIPYPTSTNTAGAQFQDLAIGPAGGNPPGVCRRGQLERRLRAWASLLTGDSDACASVGGGSKP